MQSAELPHAVKHPPFLHKKGLQSWVPWLAQPAFVSQRDAST